MHLKRRVKSRAAGETALKRHEFVVGAMLLSLQQWRQVSVDKKDVIMKTLRARKFSCFYPKEFRKC